MTRGGCPEDATFHKRLLPSNRSCCRKDRLSLSLEASRGQWIYMFFQIPALDYQCSSGILGLGPCCTGVENIEGVFGTDGDDVQRTFCGEE